jgi:hypothetical protein
MVEKQPPSWFLPDPEDFDRCCEGSDSWQG